MIIGKIFCSSQLGKQRREEHLSICPKCQVLLDQLPKTSYPLLDWFVEQIGISIFGKTIHTIPWKEIDVLQNTFENYSQMRRTRHNDPMTFYNKKVDAIFQRAAVPGAYERELSDAFRETIYCEILLRFSEIDFSPDVQARSLHIFNLFSVHFFPFSMIVLTQDISRGMELMKQWNVDYQLIKKHEYEIPQEAASCRPGR